jgi:hypothetical protein
MKHKNPPFVMVTNQVLDSPAWCAMSTGARCLYIALKRRCPPNRYNNGRIRLSQREVQKQLGAGFTQIARWFRELQHYGFIVMTEAGCLGVEGKGKAPQWRLTEVAYMRGTSSRGGENMPTMDFLKWDGIRFSKHHPGGDHLKSAPENRSTSALRKKTESRSRKPERTAPENQSTRAPENQSTSWNNRSRKPEHTADQSAPENRSSSYKPSGVGRAGSLLKPSNSTPEPGPSAAVPAVAPNGTGSAALPDPWADLEIPEVLRR